MTSVFLQVATAFAIAVAGGALALVLARTHKQLCTLISLGAGTLLGVAIFAIAPESLETLRWWEILLAAGTGYGLFGLIASTMQQMSVSFGEAAASLAKAFFIPDRFRHSAPEIIRGVHQACLCLGGLTILSAIAFRELKNNDGDTVSQHNAKFIA